MKQKFKKLLGILSLVVLLITFSCTEDLYKDETHSNYNLSFKKISYGEVSTNKKLVSKLSKLKNEKQTKDANGKIIYSSEYEFYVDTDNGNYIEDENGKHSYVFRVYRKSVQNKLDNIVFASQDDNTYKVLLISYDLTPQEQQNLENGNTINVSDNPRTIYLIEDENLTNDIFNRVTVIVTGGCITIIEESCSSGKHDDYTGYGGCQPAYHTVNTYTNCESDGGGGSYSGYTGTGSYNNPTGNTSTTTGSSGNDGTGTTNSGGTSSTGNNTVYTTPTLGNIKSFEQIEREKCFMNDSGLTWNQKAFLNNNPEIKAQILAFLENQVTDNNSACPKQQAIDIAIDAINSLMDDECAILPINNSNDTSTYTGDIGDEVNQDPDLDHDAIKSQFETLLNNNDKIGAINYLISSYSMEWFGNLNVVNNYTFNIIAGTEPEATTTSNFSSNGSFITSNIEIKEGLLTYSDFGWITRALKHELFHVFQAKYYPFGATTNNEREFEAYWYSIYRFDKLKRGNDASETRWAYKVRDFYYAMTDSQKALVVDKWKRFLLDYKEICQD